MADYDAQNDIGIDANPLLSDLEVALLRKVAECKPGEPGWQTLLEVPREADAHDPDQLLNRITCNPEIFGGKPTIRGMRFAVQHVLGMLAAGESVESILEQYSLLEPEDIQACFVLSHRLATVKHLAYQMAAEDRS